MKIGTRTGNGIGDAEYVAAGTDVQSDGNQDGNMSFKLAATSANVPKVPSVIISEKGLFHDKQKTISCANFHGENESACIKELNATTLILVDRLNS